MSIFEYNFRNILVLVACIVGICYLVYYLLIKHNRIKWFNKNVVKNIYACVVVFVCLIFSFSFAESKTRCIEGKVSSIVRTGSIGDFIVNYTFWVSDENGNEFSYNTPIISSRRYIKKLEAINEDDEVIIYCGDKLHYILDMDVITTEIEDENRITGNDSLR